MGFGSQPLEGNYKVKVHYYSKRDFQGGTVSFRVEVQVEGMEASKIFDGRLSTENDEVSIFSFDYTRGGINGFGRVSKEVYESSAVPNITHLDTLWNAKAWSTYLWKYAYDVLLEKGKQGMKKWRAVFFVDGYDNDSPGAYRGPTGFNEMMNQLFRKHVHPEINIICFGSDECERAKDAQHEYNPWLALTLSTGGCFQYVPENASPECLRTAVDDFYSVFADLTVKRIGHRKAAKKRWLELTMSSPSSMVNANQEYTKHLQLRGVDADLVADEGITRNLKDLPAQVYRSDL